MRRVDGGAAEVFELALREAPPLLFEWEGPISEG